MGTTTREYRRSLPMGRPPHQPYAGPDSNGSIKEEALAWWSFITDAIKWPSPGSDKGGTRTPTAAGPAGPIDAGPIGPINAMRRRQPTAAGSGDDPLPGSGAGSGNGSGTGSGASRR